MKKSTLPRLPSATVDQLGLRLREALTLEDLHLLDQYRREFRDEYDSVVYKIRTALGIEVSGRPAKSTPAIVGKLKRSTMRLSQMQDIAGCRIVVKDIAAQDALVDQLVTLFPSNIIDRRAQPSHGYRAVHVVAKPTKRCVEIQVRTQLQHLWAELSEKSSDIFGIETKYGGGDNRARDVLNRTSNTVAEFEGIESNSLLVMEVEELRLEIERLLSDLLVIVGKYRDAFFD
jgi:putative GTP pyrophosphokinase